MLHLTKLAVGIRDIAHLRAVQAERAVAMPPLRHRTRTMPRRRDEILGGAGNAPSGISGGTSGGTPGSIYWVVAGTLLVRQRLLDIIEDTWDDGSRCTGLLLDPVLVQVEGRPVKPFQGWRYLGADAAPPDLNPDAPPDDLPPALRNELRALGLI